MRIQTSTALRGPSPPQTPPPLPPPRPHTGTRSKSRKFRLKMITALKGNMRRLPVSALPFSVRCVPFVCCRVASVKRAIRAL
ncbi:hypothetical protein JCGZ_13433 [Jatropha curcas]|uniref:Uncharacterized protein n=1 Tax=Jatropha curcas TaxID=180498 RepID=A0A067KDT9_JATCU|nr:hypothetical protein JCGZ_13433 [Jatropha curcas]